MLPGAGGTTLFPNGTPYLSHSGKQFGNVIDKSVLPGLLFCQVVVLPNLPAGLLVLPLLSVLPYC